MIPDLPPVVFTSEQEAPNDPLTSALDWAESMAGVAERSEEAERTESVSRSYVRSPTSVEVTSGLPSLLYTIRAHESGGNYQRVSAPGLCGAGRCYGAYQLHYLYMDDWARRYGAAAYAGTPASQWPSGIQDRVALGLFYSTNPDGAHWCNWTDYC